MPGPSALTVSSDNTLVPVDTLRSSADTNPWLYTVPVPVLYVCTPASTGKQNLPDYDKAQQSILFVKITLKGHLSYPRFPSGQLCTAAQPAPQVQVWRKYGHHMRDTRSPTANKVALRTHNAYYIKSFVAHDGQQWDF